MFYTIESIAPICRKLRAVDRKLVLATGFFDLLHEEHIKFLQKAKAEGDGLIVAVESDARAAKIKGQGRPVETQSVRSQHILEGGLADYIVVLGDDFDHQEAYDSLMAAVRPDIYAVSSHTDYLDNKRKLAGKYGGKLAIVHEWNSFVSTTAIVNSKIKI